MLNEYGIKPIKLMRIIKIKRGHISSFNPFRWNENVRFSCDMIVEVKVVDNILSR